MSIGPVIGGIGQGLGSLIGGIGSIITGVKANKINEDNFNLQVENLEYQKALQQQMFEREDSAYQRTVNDMRQAGLSPLAMNGTNSSGSVVNTTAPQNQFTDMLSNVVGVASALGSIAQVQSGIARTDAETQYIKEQAENLSIKNNYEADRQKWETGKLQQDVANSVKDTEAMNYYGYSNSMPDAIKQLLILSSGKSIHSSFEASDGYISASPDEKTVYQDTYVRDNQTLSNNEVLRYISPVLEILKAFK